MTTHTQTEKPMTKKHALTTPTERTIRVERVFDAPRARVWQAYTDPKLVAQWWGRGNKVVVEKFELKAGGHWRFVEHSDNAEHGFEGRFREITPMDRISQTFEWDGMPGHPVIDTATFVDLPGGKTKIIAESQFFSQEERDGMMAYGMEDGMALSYEALDRLLATL
jgi:uncharacterized protein YndB with AHSA1/START domain